MSIDNLDFTSLALLSASLTALMTAYLGVLTVLRRITFVGVALAQLATAGIAMSGLLHIPCSLGAVILMLGGVTFFAKDHRQGLPSEGLIGSAYVAAGAAAVLFIALSPHADSDMLSLLFGNVLAVTSTDIYLMTGSLAFIVIVSALFFKQFMLTSFDPMMAQALGYNVKFWNWLFYFTVGLAIAVAIHSAGALLVFAMLIVPPLTGLCLSHRWRWVCATSLISALASVFTGVALSVRYDLPTSASITAVTCSFLVISLIIKRLRQTN
ncbi:MAG: metal ABC transporter permease [Candidatus Bruticola sp.]